jgi:hypothetical protein
VTEDWAEAAVPSSVHEARTSKVFFMEIGSWVRWDRSGWAAGRAKPRQPGLRCNPQGHGARRPNNTAQAAVLSESRLAPILFT